MKEFYIFMRNNSIIMIESLGKHKLLCEYILDLK
jgi:hypothetical protein